MEFSFPRWIIEGIEDKATAKRVISSYYEGVLYGQWQYSWMKDGVTSERDYLARRVESLQITLNSINDDNDHMRQRIAEFEAAANAMRSTFDALIGSGDTTAATLKPRQCCAKCDARAEAVRAAAKFELEQMSRDRQGDVEVVILSCAKKISAMPLPPCADCNPLAPEA